ncbi:MAG TPA: phosphate ABC transporter substrate-binding protein [Candidatus Kapabacteria bacterium]
MKKTILSYLISIALVGLLGCGKSSDKPADQGAAGNTITVKGSDTMVQLAQRWAEAFMGADKEVSVQVTGGGSGTGVSALINGTTDICMSSRPMKDKEKEQMLAKYKSAGVQVTVARDGLTVYLHGSNPVKELSMEQLKKIYLGQITNWKEVGGKDATILLYSRENNSGTYVFFKEHVLENEDFAQNAQTLPGTAAVVNAITKDPNGIGYGGAGYAKGIKECAIKKDDASPALLPLKENIDNNSYALSRGLYFYLKGVPEGKIKSFVDWILSPAGQEVVTKEGFFTVR